MIRWAKKVAEHDYGAALAYLTLRFDKRQADLLVKRLKEADVEQRRANDILRACNREPLPITDPGVHRSLLKVLAGERLSPVLLVSFPVGGDVADGYHRVSLAYALDPFGDVPCKIASVQ